MRAPPGVAGGRRAPAPARRSPAAAALAWLALAALLAASGPAAAQQAQSSVGRGPHYVDVPADLQVVAEGFEESPQPTIEVEPPEGATLELVGVSPNISTSVRIVNGRMSQSRRVQFVYRYRLVPQRPGRISVGPFRVSQDGTSAEADAVALQAEAVPSSADQQFRLVLPDGPVWVGQRVPVTVEWWVAERDAAAIAGRSARVPLFEHLDAFRFEDEAVPDAGNSLVVDTPSGSIELPATVRRTTSEGKPYLVLSAKREMVPLKPGRVEVAPASIVVQVATRWRRDLFGERIPTAVRRIRAEDRPRTLVVEAPPAAGRPPSFSGAVGRGFSIEASAERSVVQVGDPIRLRLVVRGDAALETVSLPPLAESGLDPHAFRVSDAAASGVVENGAKRFNVVVRAIDESVHEIPPIALSWFDPDRGAYETVRSHPIALSVRPATVVSAADVVRAPAPGEAGDADAAPTADPSTAAGSAGSRPAFTLSGAELSIETRDEMLLRDPTPWPARPAAEATFYATGLLGLALAVVARRRAALNPDTVARARALRAERRSVAGASCVVDLARALRRMAAVSGRQSTPELEALLRDCDEVVYAPGEGGSSPVTATLRERAAAVADALLEAAG